MDKSMIAILIDNIGSPAFVTGEDGAIIFKNRQMRYIRERLNKPELFHLNDMAIVVDEKREEAVYSFHIEQTTVGGLMYYINMEGERVRLFIFDNAIASDRLIENVIEHIDEVIVIFNREGVLERMNSICDQMLPFKRRDVIGKNISELVKAGWVENPIIHQLIDKKEKVYKDIIYPNGKVISYTAIPIFGASGRFKGGVLTGRDISRIINLAKTVIGDDAEDVEYISENNEINEIKSMIARVAPSDASVFIMGESGVGKEILTRSVWKQSARRDKPFIAINCAAIPSELIESELFGYERGAFTGAKTEGKIGLIEAADGGTLFLDEVGELPLETQKKLLRVLQEKSVMRIGGVKSQKVDVRFISATNKSIEELKNPEVFRQDLYYRLSVIPIMVPPLRSRPEDIVPICNFYVEYFNKKYGRNIQISEEGFKILKDHDWPGNIRELKNIIERVVVLSPYEMVSAEQMRRTLGLGSITDIKESLPQIGQTAKGEPDGQGIVISEIMNIEDAHRLVEEEILKKAVEKYGNITKAANAVGINPSTVYRKIKSGKLKL